MKTIILLLIVLLSVFFLQGCAVALVGYGAATGAGVGSAFSENQKREISQQEEYKRYMLYIENENHERAKRGEKPLPIASYDEWMSGQLISTKGGSISSGATTVKTVEEKKPSAITEKAWINPNYKDINIK